MAVSLSAETSRVHADTPKRASEDRLEAELRDRETAPGHPVQVYRADLAKALGVSDRTVRRAARRLVKAGRLDVTIRNSRYEPNVYRLSSQPLNSCTGS